MYFPYLRGRQNELLAIRDLLANSRLSINVLPIIEPVKMTPTLTSTLNLFSSKNRELIFIRNPKVGNISVDLQKKDEEKKDALVKAISCKNILPAILIDSQVNKLLQAMKTKGFEPNDIVAICTQKDNAQFFEDVFAKEAKYNIIPYKPAFRKIRNNPILIDDKFNKQDRNTDYAINDDEFFSDDHLYCYEDGYKGFSDYSIVGDEYKESGFAPYAVAIHIVYHSKDNSLRVKHFVSDTNDDISDPANKFYEAVSKLVVWNKQMRLNTLGINLFEEMHANGSYPGLGVVKKLSIMHHLELVGNFLDGI